MENSSRRSFLRKTIAAGSLLSTFPTLGVNQVPEEKISPNFGRLNLPDGALVLFQGDSITDGNRGRSSDPNHIMGHGYAFCLAARLGADFPLKRYQFVNKGTSGDKIIDLERRWETDVLHLHPDVLSVLIGVNDAASVVADWKPVVNPDRFKEVYHKLLEQSLAVNENLKLVLCEPFILQGDRTRDKWQVYVEDIQQRQEIVRALALEFDAIYVPFQTVFNKACQLTPDNYWIWDGVHPTVAGHELMAREWLKQVSERIGF